MFYIDPVYLWCFFTPTLLISLGVQLYLQSSHRKWSQVRNKNGLTGSQVGQTLFQRTSLNPIKVQNVSGTLSDHFDPRANIVRLSDSTYGQPSIAAMAVTAHEFGHVQQYQTRSSLIGMRNFLMPALQFSPLISYFAIMFGLILNMTGLIWIGIAFFALVVFFSVLTLPVEIDASRRAIRLLQEAELLNDPQDARGARQMLNAAAMTYLAAAITSILQLLYYISLARRRR